MRKLLFLSVLLFMTFVWGILDANHRMICSDTNDKEDSERRIRVLIKNDDYESEYHSQICLYSDKDYVMKNSFSEERYRGGEQSMVNPQSALFAESDKITVTSRGGVFYFPDLVRAESGIAYEGEMEIWKTDKGLLLINELPLESYLCGVLPGEMSAAFPMEALKAQAVCARTYALQQAMTGRAEEYHADLDDSTSYQVYNNRLHSEKTDQAVKDTAGIVIIKDGTYADARYYSTSCGLDLHMDLSEDTVFAAFIQEDQWKAAESQEPFFRWKTYVEIKKFEGKDGWDVIKRIQIKERNDQGCVIRLEVTGQKQGCEQTEEIKGEYEIRRWMALADPQIMLQDKSTREGWQLLPSAFFYMQPVLEEENLTGYEIYGGGYGHGEGMSQNGAKNMANRGENWEDILKNYYGEIELCRYFSTGECTIAQ